MRRVAAVLTISSCILASCVLGGFARAEPPAERPPVSAPRRAAAIALAVVPGFLMRGTGSYLVHEKPAARRLAAIAGIGFTGMLVGGLAPGATAGNPYTILPGVPILVAGSGLFLSSWLTDIWVAARGPVLHPEPRALAPWSIELGSTWLVDAYHHRLYARGEARVELGRVELFAAGLADARGAAREGSFGTSIRLAGAAATGRYLADTTRLALRTTARSRHDDDDRVGVLTAETELLLRYDHRRIAKVLAGTFTELSTGLGIERARYDAGGHDVSTLLLGTYAWGMDLSDRGELRLFYDHRRDHMAGGLAAYRAAGFVGGFGASIDLRVCGPWAVRGELEIGSAWVTSLGVRYQGGPP